MGIGREEMEEEYEKMLIDIHETALERGKKIGIVEGVNIVASKMKITVEQARDMFGITPVNWEKYLKAEAEEKSEKELNKEIFDRRCNMSDEEYWLTSTDVYCIHKTILRFDLKAEEAMNILEIPQSVRILYPRSIFADACGYLDGFRIGYSQGYSKIYEVEDVPLSLVLKEFGTGDSMLNQLAKRIRTLALRQNLPIEQAMDVFEVPEAFREEVLRRIG